MDTTQLLKGVLDVAVLAIVREEDGYGYDIVRRLRDTGIGDVGDASVYGTLRRLYASGALSSYVVPSEGGPHRKYYAITAQGSQVLDEQTTTWTRFAVAMSQLLAPRVAGTASGDPRPASAASPPLFRPPAPDTASVPMTTPDTGAKR